MKTWASWELTASDSRTKCLTVLTCESWGRLRNIGFQTNVTHGPGAVRLLVYRRTKVDARVQTRARNPLQKGLPAPMSLKICDSCDTVVLGAPRSKALTDVSEFRTWSGGPGFEPGASRSRTVVMACPPVSRGLLQYPPDVMQGAGPRSPWLPATLRPPPYSRQGRRPRSCYTSESIYIARPRR